MVNIQSIHPTMVNRKNLIQFLSDLLYQAIKVDHSPPPNNHPIILINAVKNIIGDDKVNPSTNLCEFSKSLIDSYPVRKDDEQIWKDVIAEGTRLSVFTDEVEKAVMEGDLDKAQVETARQIIASNNSPAILELLAELAIHNVDQLGLFTYHWLRSYHFYQNEKALWSYSMCMISELFKSTLEPISQEKRQTPRDFIPWIISPENIDSIPVFAAMLRLGDGDYVRTNSFNKAISKWLAELQLDQSQQVNISSFELENYVLSGGNYFIDLAVKIINRFPQSVSVNKIIQLEALRSIAKQSKPESFQQIANCLNFLVQ